MYIYVIYTVRHTREEKAHCTSRRGRRRRPKQFIIQKAFLFSKLGPLRAPLEHHDQLLQKAYYNTFFSRNVRRRVSVNSLPPPPPHSDPCTTGTADVDTASPDEMRFSAPARRTNRIKPFLGKSSAPTPGRVVLTRGALGSD